jgi:hypothetical protein
MIFARGNAAQQPDAQLRLKAADRFAQARRAQATGARAVTKAAGARHGHKSIQLTEIGPHCS